MPSKASYTKSHQKDTFEHTGFHNSCLVVKIDWLCCPVDFHFVLSRCLKWSRTGIMISLQRQTCLWAPENSSSPCFSDVAC